MPATPNRALRRKWVAAGVCLGFAVGGAIALVAGPVGGGSGSVDVTVRAVVVEDITASVEEALGPLGLAPGPDLLAGPAAFADALAAATDDVGVVRAAAVGEGLLALLGPSRDAIAAIDIPDAVRGKGLDEAFVVDLIQARQRILDALDLYAAAARLASEAALLEAPSLAPILATASDLAAQAESTFLDGHDLLVEAQVAAGTYDGPLLPGSGAIG